MLMSCRSRTLLFLYSFACVCFSKQQKPSSAFSTYKPGDVILGALIPVHLSNGTGACGELYMFGFQLVVDIILTVERINSDRDLLPNVTLGYDIRDYCSDQGLAIKHAYWLLSNTSDLQSWTKRVGTLGVNVHRSTVSPPSPTTMLHGVGGGGDVNL